MTTTQLTYFGDLNEALPNLDGFDPTDMAAFCRECEVVESALRQMRAYAGLRSMAGELRSAGRINDALQIEHDMEAVYERLPEFARW